jgi:hypothetical protein
MFNKKELLWITIASIFIAFASTLLENQKIFFYTLLSIFIVILSNTISKKIAAYFLESEIEIKLWEFKRYGYQSGQKTKTPFPAGLLIPIISKIILFPFKGFVWMASLVFDVKPKEWRISKRHGYYSFSEMTEDHIGYIAASGIIINLILGIIGYLIGFPIFSKINIYYAFFNMIPISELDGNKIFFGNLTLWNVLALLTLLGMGYTMFLV